MKSKKGIKKRDTLSGKAVLAANEIAIKEGARIRFQVTATQVQTQPDGTLIITLRAKPDTSDVQTGAGGIQFPTCGIFEKSTPNAFASGQIEDMVLVIDSSEPPVISLKSRRNDLVLSTNATKGRQGDI